MPPENEEPKLTKAEQAFFDSSGEKPIPDADAKPETPTDPETPAVEAKDAEKSAAVEKPIEKEPAQPEEKPKMVPLAALHEERERRKELQKRVEAEGQDRARLAGRLDALNEAMRPKEQPKPLDPTTQPLEVLQELTQFRDQTLAERQQQHQMQQFTNAYASRAQEFAKETPDFKDAYKFVVDSRVRELQAIGYDATTAAQMAQNDELNIAGKAFQDGKNPAQVLYTLAEARGYKKADPAAAAAPNGSGAPPPDPMARLESKLDTIAKGQAAGKSLGGSGGAPGESLTLESLAGMSDTEFAELEGRMKGRDWEKLWTR